MSLASEVLEGFQRVAQEINTLRGEQVRRKLGSTTLGAAATSITFQNIPATYKKLELNLVARGDANATFTGIDIIVNNDLTVSAYAFERLQGTGAAASAVEFLIGGGGANTTVGLMPANTGKANSWGYLRAEFPSYSETPRIHQYLVHNMAIWLNTTGGMAVRTLGCWHNNDAVIDRLMVRASAGNFIAGTRCELYGIK